MSCRHQFLGKLPGSHSLPGMSGDLTSQQDSHRPRLSKCAFQLSGTSANLYIEGTGDGTAKGQPKWDVGFFSRLAHLFKSFIPSPATARTAYISGDLSPGRLRRCARSCAPRSSANCEL